MKNCVLPGVLRWFWMLKVSIFGKIWIFGKLISNLGRRFWGNKSSNLRRCNNNSGKFDLHLWPSLDAEKNGYPEWVRQDLGAKMGEPPWKWGFSQKWWPKRPFLECGCIFGRDFWGNAHKQENSMLFLGNRSFVNYGLKSPPLRIFKATVTEK